MADGSIIAVVLLLLLLFVLALDLLIDNEKDG